MHGIFLISNRLRLLTTATDAFFGIKNALPAKLSVYAGVGGDPGSTVQGEWSETGYKLGDMPSQFAQSPLTLISCQTPKEAWSTVCVEGLIRSGVPRFYVCPGSRATPLLASVARA